MYHKLPNSIIVKENDLGNGKVNKVVHIRGRYPKNGCMNDRNHSNIVYAMKGSGRLSSAAKHVALKPGSAVVINSGECFHLKGQFSLYFIPVS